MFDLSIGKLLVLGVLALVLFGPDQLPRIAAQAGRALRDLRRMADNAKADLRQGLGPEFADFDVADLNPKRFVRKHLLEDDFDDFSDPLRRNPATQARRANAVAGHELPAGERPPYDTEAT